MLEFDPCSTSISIGGRRNTAGDESQSPLPGGLCSPPPQGFAVASLAHSVLKKPLVHSPYASRWTSRWNTLSQLVDRTRHRLEDKSIHPMPIVHSTLRYSSVIRHSP